MNFWNYEPEIIKKTRACNPPKEGKKPGQHWAMEILIFICVFFAASFVSFGANTVVEVLSLVGNESVKEAAVAQDFELLMSEITAATSANLYLQPIKLALEVLMTITIVLFCKFIQKRTLATVGFVKKNALRDYLIGLVVGFVAFSLAVGICVVTGSLTLSKANDFKPLLFVLYVIGWFFQGMAEEVMCRGYLLPSVSRRYSVWVGVIFNSVVFAALHLLNPGIQVLPIVNLILFGIFASLVYIKTGNIWLCSAIHSVWNFVQGNFYGILVSGQEATVTVFSSEMNASKSIINGGDFGLEGGLGVTISMVIFSVIMLVLIYKDYQKTKA